MDPNSARLPLVAVDVLGNDGGLKIQVEGAVQAYREHSISSILFGPAQEIAACLDSLGSGELPLQIVDAPDSVLGDEPPSRAVRRKSSSSLVRAFSALAAGDVVAMVSAGNSGAVMAAGMFSCGLMPGIERPAIATLIPGVRGSRPLVVLDSGANVDCRAQHLVQFAVMGAVYFSALFGSAPRIGLLSNGSEGSKGTDLTRAAAQLISKLEWINYGGYVEGRVVATREVDVVVCDGFAGNILLKGLEGASELMRQALGVSLQANLWRRLVGALLTPLFQEVFREQFDYSAYGGAPLLGLEKLALVLHGASSVRAVKNAIRAAHTFNEQRMVEKLRAELVRLQERTLDEFFRDMFKGRPPAETRE